MLFALDQPLESTTGCENHAGLVDFPVSSQRPVTGEFDDDNFNNVR